jgi:hypothetical protein
MAGPIHYEVFVRKTPPSPWTLAMATEDRTHAVESAEEMLAVGSVAAVRVTKETLDAETMGFASVTILTKGAPEPKRRKVEEDSSNTSVCNAPNDLYSPIAREKLGHLLEDWLRRNRVCAYELLHRADLLEKLDASGVELQHAIQKLAVPESQATGRKVHDLIRHYQRLAEVSIARVLTASQRGNFVDLNETPLSEFADKMVGRPDGAFMVGGAICRATASGHGPRDRVALLMNLVDQAPAQGPGRALVLSQIEQLLSDVTAQPTGLASILGPGLAPGAALAAIIRMCAPNEVEAVIRADARIGQLIPKVDGDVARLGLRMAVGEFPTLARSLIRMVLRELSGTRRLQPGHALGEIAMLRALAAAMAAATGRLLSPDEVKEAFIERSKMLVTADFVGACTADQETALQEVESLTRLCENVTGGANKRAAARWLVASLTSIRFETEMRAPGLHPVQKLSVLAGLQRSIRACALGDPDQEQALAAVGVIGGMVEADARLIALMARAEAPPAQKLTALLRVAAGQTGPLGPAADRAKAEVLKLMKAPETRNALAAAPDSLVEVRSLMKSAGMAA